MKQVSFTKHASVRCQQRGIGEKVIPLIMDYGHFNYGRDGSKVYCLNKTERSMVRADLGKSLFNKIEKAFEAKMGNPCMDRVALTTPLIREIRGDYKSKSMMVTVIAVDVTPVIKAEGIYD